MKRKEITILVPKGAVAESVSNPRYMFMAANQFLQSAGQPPLFHVQLAGEEKEVAVHDGFSIVRTDKVLEEIKETDLIIIPALFGDLKRSLNENQKMIPWIVDRFRDGSEVASLCVGAFLLASTGLLDGKKCSTHWVRYNEFREMFPEVEVMDGKIITEEDGLYTSGGANSYWNLLLYLLEKFTNRETAIIASKYFAIDIDRNTQNSFMMFQGQKDHLDPEVKQVQQYIEENYQEKIAVDELADMVAVSRRSFERRFKKSTHNTIVEYIQRVKVEAAKRSFEASRKNINQVMFDVGYSDTKAFRNVFKRITGLTPIEYRNKYNSDKTRVN
jgi:transcriptional regulator GlxA family with amidase domain